MELYILHSHPFLAYFQKDLFLADLESGKTQFCSSLLVNAVLACATHYDQSIFCRNEPWNTQSLSYRFFAEAKRLWDLEMGESKLTNLQATLILSSVYHMDGLDEVGYVYLVHAAKISGDLDLFVIPTKSEQTDMDVACQFTAWCLFSWQAIILCHYYKSPLFELPPRAELPDPQKDPTFYGEIYVKYHGSNSPHPVNFPSAFFETAKFRILLNNVANDLFKGTKKTFRIGEAVSYYQQFMQWFQNLPACLTPSHIAFPYQLMIHLHYQHVILLLFGSFLASDMSTTSINMPSKPRTTILSVVKEAEARFETLIRLYHLRHSFTTYAPVMLQFLSVLGFMIVGRVKNTQTPSDSAEDRISSLLLAIQGLHHQGPAAHLSNVVFCLLYKELPTDTVNLANKYFELNGTDMSSHFMTQHTKAAFPVNAVGIDADVEQRRLNVLLEKLQTEDSDAVM